IEKLDGIAGYLGFGTSEIFPKQASISRDEKNQDFGSWINMPYFGGVRNLRYGLDDEGKALGSVARFREYVNKRRLSPEEFRQLEAPTKTDIFPDGPPCLNSIFSAPPTDNRNVLLANVAVYAKKVDPDRWRDMIDRYNAK